VLLDCTSIHLETAVTQHRSNPSNDGFDGHSIIERRIRVRKNGVPPAMLGHDNEHLVFICESSEIAAAGRRRPTACV
jgi:hypothetical protein